MAFSLLETIALYAVPVVLAITLHEAAHGYVARRFGDQTAWMLGRVTLNPLRHIDPIGTVVVPLALLLASKLLLGGGFLFGWAKPVPVNFANLRDPKRDMLWVAAAGPAMNFALALAWGWLLRLATGDGVLASGALAEMGDVGVKINIVLMVLNLLPILPLDGGRIAVSLLPHGLALRYARLERFGFVVILVLLATGVLERLMTPLVDVVWSVVATIVGL